MERAKEKQKVFLLIRYLQRSGAPKILLWLAENLAMRGYDVTLYCFSNIVEVDVPKSVRFIHDDLSRCGIFSKVNHLRKHLKEVDADIAISFLLDANVYNIFACLGIKTKSVVCERNDPFKPHYYKLKFWKPWFRLTDGAVFQLPKVAEYYNNIKGKTAVIPNPVGKADFEVKKSFMKRDDEIVTVGRIDYFQKRHDVLIEAFAKFLDKHPSYHLTIYGGGEDNDVRQIKDLIGRLGISKSISLAGAVTNPTEKILNAKMFVLSSDFEGIPNALIEAMSVGLPCISTDCRPGGARLLIEDGKNGLVVPAGDDDALYEKMNYLAGNPDVADQMGNEARNIAVRFSCSEIIKKWDNYLKSLLS